MKCIRMGLALLLALMLFVPSFTSCGGEKSYQESQFSGTTTCLTPAQLAADLDGASQADVIPLSGVNPLVCPEVPMSHTWSGGKLIFSDSPEKPTSKGKLYEDDGFSATGSESNRVFVYHVNGQKKKMKFAILLKNTSSTSGTLTLQKKGTAGPTTNYLYAGKVGFHRWLTSTASAPVNVPAGDTVRLITDIETPAAENYLMHGIYDYTFDQSHKVTICAIDQRDKALKTCPRLSILPRDVHQRGTFPYADKVYDSAAGYAIDTADGIVQFSLAYNTANDPYAVGVDATDGSPQILVGNYGILYRMHLNTSASDGQKLGFLFNPRGGQWGGAAWPVSGITPGGKFLVPPNAGSTGDNTNGAVAGKYNPGSSFTFWMQWMPTGGSNMPLRFLAVPY